jgi:hypothetical protein
MMNGLYSLQIKKLKNLRLVPSVQIKKLKNLRLVPSLQIKKLKNLRLIPSVQTKKLKNPILIPIMKTLILIMKRFRKRKISLSFSRSSRHNSSTINGLTSHHVYSIMILSRQ